MSSSPTSLAGATPPAPGSSTVDNRRDISKCNECDCRFTWLKHHHRCGSCLEAVCNACSLNRKAIPGYIPPRHICDGCFRVRWAAEDSKAASDETQPLLMDKNGCRLSVTVSTPDADALGSTSTAPLSPGSPPAVFFGSDFVIASTAADGEDAGGAAGVSAGVEDAVSTAGLEAAADDDGEEVDGENGKEPVITSTWKAWATAGVAVGTGVAVAVLVLRVVGRGRR